MKDSLFNEETLLKIHNKRDVFHTASVWTLIAGLVIGAVTILIGGLDSIFAKIQGSFLIVVLILLVSANNFRRMEKGNKPIQLFSLIGFISNYICGIFALLIVWEIVQPQWPEEVMHTISYSEISYSTTTYHLTIYAMIMLISAYAAAAGFLISNILSIKETIKLVKPLKITAVVCIVYLWAIGTITAPIEPENESISNLLLIAVLAWTIFPITTIDAFIISKINKDKAVSVDIAPTKDVTQPTIKQKTNQERSSKKKQVKS